MIVVDTSAIYALADPKDKNHRAAREYLERELRRQTWIVTSPVLTETWFLCRARSGLAAAFQVVEKAVALFHLTATETGDLEDALAVHAAYPDQTFSLVDCLLMALCERDRIDTVFTFDRKDFSIYRPRFTPFLTLVP